MDMKIGPTIDLYDIIVIGGGVMGSAAAYHSAKAGSKTLLLESKHFLHRTGSSHGESRIVRKTYTNETYTHMMIDSYKEWKNLEEDSGISLLHTTGGLNISLDGSVALSTLSNACRKYSIHHYFLKAKEMYEQYGISLASNETVLYQEDTGIVNATTVVATLQSMARKYGATLTDHCRVCRLATHYAGSNNNYSSGDTALTPTTSSSIPSTFDETQRYYEVSTTDKRVFYGKKIILCPGAWVRPLVKELLQIDITNIDVWQCTVMYFRSLNNVSHETNEPSPQTNTTTVSSSSISIPMNKIEKLPVIIDYGIGSTTSHAQPSLNSNEISVQNLDIPIYSCPSYEYPHLVKFAVHRGLLTTADTRTFVPDNELTVQPVQQWLKARLPWIDADTPLHTETCLYTVTPDEDFIIDTIRTIPDYRNGVYLGSICSGHGFKFGPLMGKWLYALASNKHDLIQPSVDYLRLFSLDRSCLGMKVIPEIVK